MAEPQSFQDAGRDDVLGKERGHLQVMIGLSTFICYRKHTILQGLQIN